MTGIVAHTYPEWWLKLTGQAAQAYRTGGSLEHRLFSKASSVALQRKRAENAQKVNKT